MMLSSKMRCGSGARGGVGAKTGSWGGVGAKFGAGARGVAEASLGTGLRSGGWTGVQTGIRARGRFWVLEDATVHMARFGFRARDGAGQNRVGTMALFKITLLKGPRV